MKFADNSKIVLHIKKSARYLKDISVRTYEEFMKDYCMARAGSLSYSTLMAVVPLFAFVIALLTAFGSLEELIDEIQIFLVNVLVPTKQDEFARLIEQFIKNSQALGTIGFLLFAVTSINLIDNVSMTINSIWGSKPKKNVFSKFTTYTSSLLFGSLLIAISFTGRRFLTNIMPPEVGVLWSFIVVFVPTLFMYAAIFLLIGIVPGIKVGFKYSAIGALAGVILWELAKKAFVEGSSYVLRASVMYGSLALIPIFLFWLNIVWMIILGAAELTFCLQFRAKPWSVHSFPDMDPGQKFYLGIQIYMMISRAFRSGEQPPDRELIARKFGISLDDVHSFTAVFRESGLLLPVGKDEWSMVPARPLDTITFRDLLLCLIGHSGENPETGEYFNSVWNDIKQRLDTLEGFSVDDYLINEIVDNI